IADWIGAAPDGSGFQEGSLTLNYQSESAADVGALLTVTDTEHHFSLDVPDEMPMSYTSSKLEGMWWLPAATSEYHLVISNMGGSSSAVTLTPNSQAKGAINQPLTLTLGPHQVRVLSLGEIVGPKLGPVRGLGNVGGIRIVHSGQPGTVLAYGMVRDNEKGISSRFPFFDPTTGDSSTLSATHILVGAPDIAGLPANASFSATAILRNISSGPLTVSPEYGYDKNGEAKSM